MNTHAQQVSPGTSVGLSIANLSEIRFSANDTPASVSHTHPIEIYHYRKQSKAWEPSPTHQANLNVISQRTKVQSCDRRSNENGVVMVEWNPLELCEQNTTRHHKTICATLHHYILYDAAGNQNFMNSKRSGSFCKAWCLGQNCWQGMQLNSHEQHTVPTWASSCYYFVLISLCMDYANLPAWSIMVYSVANNLVCKEGIEFD